MKSKTINLALALALTLGLASCDPLGVDTGLSTIEITEDITESVTWESGKTYLIDGTIRVSGNITIEPGTIIEFTNDATLEFAYWENDYATVTAIGTEDEPIIFTSASSSPKAGDYNGLNFYSGANNCVFRHCVFEYGGKNEFNGYIYIEDTSVEFSCCQFRNISNNAINLNYEGAFSTFENNTFTNIGKHAISIAANNAHTIGANNNFQVSSGYGIYLPDAWDFDAAGTYTWLAHNAPYIVDGNLRIGADGNGVNLTITPGAVIKFTAGAIIEAAYWDDDFTKIIAKGTAEDPILFTSNSSSPTAGDYHGVDFFTGARNCEFDYVTFEYAGPNDDYYGAITIENTSVKFTNCTFKNFKHSAFKLEIGGQFTQFTGNTFTSIGKHPIQIRPNYVHTIGANNTFNAAANTGILISNDEEFDKQGTYTWLNHDAPYIVEGNLRIGATGSGVNLTIAAGTTFQFMNNAILEIPYWDDSYAVIRAQGTANNPIVFTSNSPSPAKGDWWGIDFRRGCIGSSFDYCEILYAGSSDYWGAVNLVDEAGSNPVSFTNSRIAHSGSHGITVDAESTLDYSSITFEDIDGNNYVVL
jgi:hypothetical protein